MSKPTKTWVVLGWEGCGWYQEAIKTLKAQNAHVRTKPIEGDYVAGVNHFVHKHKVENFPSEGHETSPLIIIKVHPRQYRYVGGFSNMKEELGNNDSKHHQHQHPFDKFPTPNFLMMEEALGDIPDRSASKNKYGSLRRRTSPKKKNNQKGGGSSSISNSNSNSKGGSAKKKKSPSKRKRLFRKKPLVVQSLAEVDLLRGETLKKKKLPTSTTTKRRVPKKKNLSG